MDVSAMFPKQVLQIFCSVNFRPFSVSKERSEFVNKFRVGKHPSILQIIHAPGRQTLFREKHARGRQGLSAPAAHATHFYTFGISFCKKI